MHFSFRSSPIVTVADASVAEDVRVLCAGKHQDSTSTVAGGHPDHGGAIAGAVIGGIAAVGLIILAACAFAHARRRGCGLLSFKLYLIPFVPLCSCQRSKVQLHTSCSQQPFPILPSVGLATGKLPDPSQLWA